MMYSTRDSSLWFDEDSFSAYKSRSDSLYIGVVRSTKMGSDKIIRYIVEVNERNLAIPVACVQLSRFGGIHNYEEISLRPYLMGDEKTVGNQASQLGYDVRAGDVVVVGYLGGDSREGVILGCLQHGGRGSIIDDKKIIYRSVFNGFEVSIRADGTYTSTWKGLPTNTETLDESPNDGAAIPPAPKYDEEVAGTFWGVDTVGSFTVSDSKGQKVQIQKDNKRIVIESGGVRVEVGESGMSGKTGCSVKATAINLESESLEIHNSKTHLQTKDFIAKSDKIAIGNSTTELLKTLTDLVTELGLLIVFSPVGPCNPLNQAVTWPKVDTLNSKIKAITGTISDVEKLSKVEDEDRFIQ